MGVRQDLDDLDEPQKAKTAIPFENKVNWMSEPQLIKNWKELKECKSDTHYLKIEEHSGWIYSNSNDDYHYLSTHTFYGKTHEGYTKLLQSCGFNVVLANWDA